MLNSDTSYEAVVIGVSAGGLKALKEIISNIPKDFSMSVIIVHHIAEDSDNDFLCSYLNNLNMIFVQEAEQKEFIVPGNVYLAPPGYHLLVEEDKTFSLSMSEKVNHSRPSIDVLFESATKVYKEKLVGVVLTGASSDGSLGLKQIKDAGGLVIVQDPLDAEVNSMPRESILTTQTDIVLPLNKIGLFLCKINN